MVKQCKECSCVVDDEQALNTYDEFGFVLCESCVRGYLNSDRQERLQGQVTSQEPSVDPVDECIISDDNKPSVGLADPVKYSSGTNLLSLIHEYVGNDVLEVFGDTGSGKSKFALAVAKEAIASGKKVYYLDTERNLTPSDIASLKGCEYKYTPMIEEIDSICQKLPAVDVVIIDSIGFPVLTTFARMKVKQKGDALLRLIAIFGDLKQWAYRNNGVAIVTNQPESEFNKDPNHILRPFGDKSQFAAKEIWKTKITSRSPGATNVIIESFRSRSVGHGSRITSMTISKDGVEVKQ